MRMYQPNLSVNLEGSNSKTESHQNQITTPQQQPPQQRLAQPKPNEEVQSNNKINEPIQEQHVFVVDGDSDVDMNDEAMQIKNLYGLISKYSLNDN